jgi:membrane protein YfhO
MTAWRRERWIPPALLALFTLFFYWKVLFRNRYMFPWDASDFFYPYFSFVHEELRHLRFPLWNPYSLGGSPIIADPEAQIFYPPAWLLILAHPFSALPFKWYEALEVAHFFLAGLFLFYLARDFTRNTLASLLGGVLFMSSGEMVAHTEHVASIEAMAWYPLVFLLARRGLLQKEWRWTVLAGLFFGVENLVGHWQHAVYLGLLLFLYFAYEALAGPLRRHLWPGWLLQLAVIALIGGALAMVQIVPTAELSALSIRTQITYWDVTQGNDPRFLWTVILPNFFGGLNGVPWLEDIDPSMNYIFLTVPGCVLALVGLMEMARRRNFFWLGLIAMCVDLSFGRNGYLAHFIYSIPLLNLFRQTPAYFDLANVALCLMAAFGMKTLIDRDTRAPYFRWLPAALVILLAGSAAWGFRHQTTWNIPGWYHALAALALTALIVALWRHSRIRPWAAQCAVLGLVVFELCYYNMNQVFNWSMNDPRTTLSQDYAVGRRMSLDFLRADSQNDFRIAAIDGFPWGSNSCNVWRLRCTLGWNPVMLRGYREYIRQIFHIQPYGQPDGGAGHRLDSPLLDLLGVKYVLALTPDLQDERLADQPKFEKAFAEPDWRAIYRNKEYVSHGSVYPHAYTLPDRTQVLALMNSRWFRPRETLLYARQDLPASTRGVEPIPTVQLRPQQIAASSAGGAKPDDECAEARTKFRDWNGKDNWVRFDTAAALEPGRYTVLLEYASAGDGQPVLTTEVTQNGHRQPPSTTTLTKTSGWSCYNTRFADLGDFDLAAGGAQVQLTLPQDTGADLFALLLARLPGDPSVAPVDDAGQTQAAFSEFATADPNRYSFQVDLKADGFVLINELYYPGWEVTVDGKPAEIRRADHIFRSLALPAGSHRIAMRFRPRRFWWGAGISLVTLCGLLFYFGVDLQKKRQSHRTS